MAAISLRSGLPALLNTEVTVENAGVDYNTTVGEILRRAYALSLGITMNNSSQIVVTGLGSITTGVLSINGGGVLDAA